MLYRDWHVGPTSRRLSCVVCSLHIPNDYGGATEKLASPPRVVELSPHDKATALLLEDRMTA